MVDELNKTTSAINKGKLSIRKAAEKYRVKKSTLADHVKGKHLGRQGGPIIIPADVE